MNTKIWWAASLGAACLILISCSSLSAQQPNLWAVLEGHEGSVWSVTFSPDSRMVASGSADHKIKVWEVITGKLRATLLGHTSWVRSVAFCNFGQVLASCGQDCTIKLWD